VLGAAVVCGLALGCRSHEAARGEHGDADEAMPVLPPPSCNGSAALCERPYDTVAFATTHNSMAATDDGWFLANQRHGVARQLADGVRGLMLDLHYSRLRALNPFGDPRTVFLCHGVCIPGAGRLDDTLATIRGFLRTHPHEVVTLILESYVQAKDAERAFTRARLLPYLHVQPAGRSWPTLRQMIESRRRLVVFTDRGGGEPAWYHDLWTYAWDTRWRVQAPALFSCEPDRGAPTNLLFILNHFVTGTFGPGERLARLSNFNPAFLDRARLCQQARGQMPNFVAVDYYDQGDLFAVVGALNGLVP
jgi:hypothetical protein